MGLIPCLRSDAWDGPRIHKKPTTSLEKNLKNLSHPKPLKPFFFFSCLALFVFYIFLYLLSFHGHADFVRGVVFFPLTWLIFIHIPGLHLFFLFLV
jgi:hypothetical protein